MEETRGEGEGEKKGKERERSEGLGLMGSGKREETNSTKIRDNTRSKCNEGPEQEEKRGRKQTLHCKVD